MIAVYPDTDGIDTLFVVVKATFLLGPPVALSVDQLPVTLADQYWGEPVVSSLKYASDMHLAKPGTDVALVGQAWAPGNRPVQQLDVRLAVAEREQVVRISGNRVWRDGAMTYPEPFQSMPLVYEYAYGGTHVIDVEKREMLAEERNPIGCGFTGKRNARELEGLALPNIEDPKTLLRSPGDKADPLCFGFTAPSWLPRRAYAGTYDAGWEKHRAPYLPEDFDPRFFQSAHPSFVFDRYLQGGETVQLDNLSRRGPLRFTLPKCRLTARVLIAGRTETPSLHLDTILLEPDEDRFSLTFRGAVRCDKQALKVEQVDINMKSLVIAGMAA